ncbi:ESCO1/2 acetyl-transferase-domain-containing protein [Kickxella alabastrina]|uniref:ESCO1/2 acetyl-transferase-domain-containing protein n=1 Tax=Kickxella alabastrina TaxID=61397 RepID=UPI00221EFCBE|nr:ESCO1/2 acetyl-transferase-domain-containing protein [Kickxella alabastrina]KAI7822823.1 ESCO1/2 acetyl-transferase-domain-containing protein [Kickxella alabastrina]KAJ1938597.1 hypothetical protein GGF37_004747 [Kickxella alabastrina]
MSLNEQRENRLKTAAVRVTYGSSRPKPTASQNACLASKSVAYPVTPELFSETFFKSAAASNDERNKKLQAKRKFDSSVGEISSGSSSCSNSEKDGDSNARRRAKKTLVQKSLFISKVGMNGRGKDVISGLPVNQSLRKRQNGHHRADKSEGDGSKKEQTFLDFGQKPISQDPCKQCGMTFQRGRPDDEELHSKFHRSWQRHQSRLLAWGFNSGIVDTGGMSNVRVIDGQESPKREIQRALEILNIANEHLGSVKLDIEDLAKQQRKIFLYVSPRGYVEGCVLAELIDSARRLVPGSNTAVECSDDVHPAVCGISRIWVAPEARRGGIALRMIEAVRARFVYGRPVAFKEMAFTQPTADGRVLAERVFGRSDFLVYAETEPI